MRNAARLLVVALLLAAAQARAQVGPATRPALPENTVVASPGEFCVGAVFQLTAPLPFRFQKVADERGARFYRDFLPAGAWIKALKLPPDGSPQFYVEVRLTDGAPLGEGWLLAERLLAQPQPEPEPEPEPIEEPLAAEKPEGEPEIASNAVNDPGEFGPGCAFEINKELLFRFSDEFKNSAEAEIYGDKIPAFTWITGKETKGSGALQKILVEAHSPSGLKIGEGWVVRADLLEMGLSPSREGYRMPAGLRLALEASRAREIEAQEKAREAARAKQMEALARQIVAEEGGGESHSGKVWVSGYTRKDGTRVKGHWRSKPSR